MSVAADHLDAGARQLIFGHVGGRADRQIKRAIRTKHNIAGGVATAAAEIVLGDAGPRFGLKIDPPHRFEIADIKGAIMDGDPAWSGKSVEKIARLAVTDNTDLARLRFCDEDLSLRPQRHEARIDQTGNVGVHRKPDRHGGSRSGRTRHHLRMIVHARGGVWRR